MTGFSGKMIFALDIDNTWTASPVLWYRFIEEAQSMGHTVIYATGRKEWTPDMDRMALRRDLQIVFCGDEPKRSVCERTGFKVDVWIDDMPAMVDGSLVIGNDEEL